MKVYKRSFKLRVLDETAENGVSILTFYPDFDKLESTDEPINTMKLARQCIIELYKNKPDHVCIFV